MTEDGFTSPETLEKYIRERGLFDESIGFTLGVITEYSKLLFSGYSRPDAFCEATKHLRLNHPTAKHVRDTLENIPGPGEV